MPDNLHKRASLSIFTSLLHTPETKTQPQTQVNRISLLPNAKPGHETNHLAASFARREGTEGFFVFGHIDST